MVKMVLAVFILLQLWLSCCTVTAVIPEIMQPPENVTVALGQGPVSLTCRVRGENIFLRVNGKIFDHNNLRTFQDRGITFSNPVSDNVDKIVMQTVTVTSTMNNNGTKVVCHGTSDDQPAANSYPATILFAGVSLPPEITYSIVDDSTLNVQWEVPYTFEGFPVIEYIVSVNNTIDSSSQSELLFSSELSNETLSFNLTHNDSTTCTNLTFVVVARNSVGLSEPGIVYGAFPGRPGNFSELPNSEVTFGQDQSVILQINFTFPTLCPYNNATYMLVIADDADSAVYTVGPASQHWSDGDAPIPVSMRETELQLDAFYRVNITVWTLVGQSSISFMFNTIYLPNSPDEGNSTTAFKNENMSTIANNSPYNNPATGGSLIHAGYIAAACVGTVLLMIALAAVSICLVYTYQRRVKRKRDCTNTTELSGHVGRSMPMVVNPIYEAGAIYEEIPDSIRFKPLPPQPHAPGAEKEEGYVSISSVTPANKAGSKSDLDKEVYTMMNSVGTLLGHLGGGAAALGSPEQAPGLYSSVADEDGASAKCGWQVPKDLDPEGRYVSM